MISGNFPLFKSKYYNILLIALIVIPTLIYDSKSRWGKLNKQDLWAETINGDGKAYYEYLRATFIYGDLTYKYIFEGDEKSRPAHLNLEYLGVGLGELKVNRQFCGTAMMVAPFFLVVYSIEKILDNTVNGYELPFQLSMSFAALFYLVLGLIWLRKLLHLFNVDNLSILIICIAFVFGSNMFFYLTISPVMSHIYSFSTLIGFMYFYKKYSLEKKPKLLYILTIFYGMALLLKPTNGMIILTTVFLDGSWSSFKTSFLSLFKHPFRLVFSVVIVLSIVFIQLLFYYLQTGHFIVWSYQRYGFDFLKPHLLEMFFGYQLGLFVYAPITFISVFTLFYYIRKNSLRLITGICFVLAIVYVFSCYEAWNDGCSYGNRFIIDFYGFLAIPLANFLSHIKNRKLYYLPAVFILVLCIVFSQVQTYQYNKYILHHANMNKEKYFRIFLKTDRPYKGVLYNASIKNAFTLKKWPSGTSQCTKPITKSGDSIIISKGQKERINIHLSKIDSTNQDLYYRIAFDAYTINMKKNIRFDVKLCNLNTLYYHRQFALDGYVTKNKRWESVKITKIMPRLKSNDDILKLEFTNKGEDFYIRNLKVKILEAK